VADSYEAVIGTPEQWKLFAERNATFVERKHRIEQACNVILNRALKDSTLLDKAVFFAGHRIADDFMEVVILAGNGEGRGAQKLLRPMFEQVVTVKYLIKHPDQIDRYWNYFRVDRRRLAKVIESTLGSEVLGPETVAAVESEFQKVKSQYEVPDCKKCGTVRFAHAWTQVDLVTMAKEVGAEVYLVGAYYLPLDQSHPKVGGMLSRIVETDSGGIAAAPRLAPDLADESLQVAHGLLILALGAQVDHFHLDSGPVVAELDRDFGEIWGKAK
jgi:hypothetical protein